MYTAKQIERLNKDIQQFEHVFPITEDMQKSFSNIQQLIMLDRYAYKDLAKKTLKENDVVVLTVKNDPKFPARGIGVVKEIDWENHEAVVLVNEEYSGSLEGHELETRMVKRHLNFVDKPLELFLEQIAKRNAHGIAEVETSVTAYEEFFEKFYKEISELNFIPAGRVLYGAGSGQNVTYFNCFVMPYPQDSREGIAKHRTEVMEIMSRGGGIGTNGSTLRPRNALARGVNGKSSGSVSWLDDIAKLTHLVEQG